MRLCTPSMKCTRSQWALAGHWVINRSSKENQEENEAHPGARDGVDDTRAIEFVNDVVVAPLVDKHWRNNQALQPSMGLDTWFKRPLKLFDGDWAEGSPLILAFDPWRMWINNASVRNKVGGYGFFRGTMNLKFILNASPYQYAQIIMSYKPLASTSVPEFATATNSELMDFSGGCMSSKMDTDISVRSRYMKRTTRWHKKMNVPEACGMEMALPFIHYDQWLRVDGTPVGPFSPGRVTINSTEILRSCSPVVSTPIEYTMYAWMDDFELTRATYFAQSYTEVKNHPASMSGPSAGTLGVKPSLGGLVRTGVHFMADAAMTALGLTKHSVLREPQPTVNLANCHLAVTDMNVPGNTLSMTSATSLTIDPSIMQPDSADHASFAHIMAKAPLVLQMDWAQDARSGYILGTGWVSPEYGFVSSMNGLNGFPYNSVEHGPHSHVASCFRYWRGPITLHFEVIKTQFHKGRIAIIYEPNSEFGGATIDTRLQVTKIMDISEVSELDFEVEFMAPRGWLQCSNWLHTPVPGTVSLATNTPTLTDIGTRVGVANPLLFNGSFRVVVINALTSPTVNSPVTIQMRVSCPRVEFAEPVDPLAPSVRTGGLTPDIWYGNLYTAQAHVDAKAEEVGADYRITMGEQVSSVRALMQRTTRFFSISSIVAGRLIFEWPLYPLPQRVLDNLAIPETVPPMPLMATCAISPSTVELACNLVRFNYINWFRGCFVGVRGGMEYRFVTSDIENPVTRVEVSRLQRAVGDVVYAGATPLVSRFDTDVKTGCSGSVAKADDNSVCVVKVPSFLPTLFAPGNPLLSNDSLAPEGITMEVWNVGGTSFAFNCELWGNIADDFSMGWYLNPPSYFLSYDTPVCISAI